MAILYLPGLIIGIPVLIALVIVMKKKNRLTVRRVSLVVCIILAASSILHTVAYSFLFIIGTYPTGWAIRFIAFGILKGIFFCGIIFGLIEFVTYLVARQRTKTNL